ncbi:MAG: DUF4411 family protein [Deltaproteobacteria bacterium]|nr:DUF4411 family protein [Deltaproteobacteria bacterium]
MDIKKKKYCLDTNVLIEAWRKYYSPEISPDYWNILNFLGREGKIFIPEHVYDEIIRTEDNLSAWIRSCDIPIRAINEQVAKCLKEIYKSNPNHKYLVNSIKGRSLADPWVIAHAIDEDAVVVTKEEKVTASNKKKNKIKIPDVCKNMNVKCINDFQLITELGIRFNCNMITE